MAKQFHPHHQTSGINHEFLLHELSFAEYLTHCEQIIRQAHRHCQSPQATQQVSLDHIIQANCPFEWLPDSAPAGKTKPYQKAVLLVHGLLDSPYNMQDLGRYFQQRGFAVRSILLPGHGTVPGDLLEVNQTAWHQAVAFGLQHVQAWADDVYLCGFSGGASLGILQALQGFSFKAMICIAPSLRLRSKFAGMATIMKRLARLHEPMKWYRVAEEYDYAKYLSFPYNFAAQAHRLARKTHQQCQKQNLTCPLFMVLSADDETVDPSSALVWFNTLNNPLNRVIIYRKQPEQRNIGSHYYFASQLPEHNILDFSHICMAIAPENPHYGINGDLTMPLSTPVLSKNNNQATIYQGALSNENLKQYRIRRLTYNPHFDSLIAQLDDFLAPIMAR